MCYNIFHNHNECLIVVMLIKHSVICF